MSDKKINVTLKSGPTYDAPWVTVGGDSEADVAFNIKSLLDNETFELVVEAAKALQTQYGGQGAAADVLGAQLAPQAQAAPAPQAAPVAAGGAPGPQCAHGAMTFRSGNKNGRTWTAHFCPTPKGTPGQCEPIFGRG